MGKLIIILGVLLSSCSSETKLEPKFSLNDKVKYKVPNYYKNVCSGFGVIHGYHYVENNKIEYYIDEKSYKCDPPWIPEENVELEKK